jgi:hypothetical protein
MSVWNKRHFMLQETLCPARNGWKFLEVGRAGTKNWQFKLSFCQNKKWRELCILYPIRLHEVIFNWAYIELKCNHQSLLSCICKTCNAYLSYIFSCATKSRRLHVPKIYKLCDGFHNHASSLWHYVAAFKIPCLHK